MVQEESSYHTTVSAALCCEQFQDAIEPLTPLGAAES